MSIKKLAYIGLRSIDSDERVIIEKFGVAAYGMSDIEKMGIHAVTQEALWKINPDGDSSIHLSFDIDALDTLEAPATGTPVRGGLTLREALILVETVQKTGRLAAIDLVEINPMIGSEQQVMLTLEAALHIIKAAFAHSRSGKIKHKVYPDSSYKPVHDHLDVSQYDLAFYNTKKKSRIKKSLLNNNLTNDKTEKRNSLLIDNIKDFGKKEKLLSQNLDKKKTDTIKSKSGILQKDHDGDKK